MAETRRDSWGSRLGIIMAVAGYFLVEMFSGNTHDRDVEAAMTSVFFWGPIGGIAAFIAGMVWGKRFSAASLK